MTGPPGFKSKVLTMALISLAWFKLLLAHLRCHDYCDDCSYYMFVMAIMCVWASFTLVLTLHLVIVVSIGIVVILMRASWSSACVLPLGPILLLPGQAYNAI